MVIHKGKGFKVGFAFTTEGVLGNNEGGARVVNLSKDGQRRDEDKSIVGNHRDENEEKNIKRDK